MKTREFEYLSLQEAMDDKNSFLLVIPAGIGSKSELLGALVTAGRFPSYFGGNWDALEDCLRDLSWIDQKEVVIVHGDLPLQSNPAECSIYLGILRAVLEDWVHVVKEKENSLEEPLTEWAYVDHELRVVFPPEINRVVADLLIA